MLPILFEFQGAALHTYSFLISLAAVAGVWLWVIQAKRYQIAADKIVNLSIWALAASWIGARALFYLTRYDDFASGKYSLWRPWEGGIVFLGGFFAAFIILIYLMPRMGVERQNGFKALAPALPFAHAIGRIGCFANGCCYGSPCDLPWAVSYSHSLTIAPHSIHLHPVQLYEALGLVALGAFLWNWDRKHRFPSYRLYLLGYGVLRFFLEFFRGDSLRGFWGPLSTSQWLSLLLVIFALLLDFGPSGDHKKPHENRN